MAVSMAFRATFDCLWCGARHTVRGPDDLEGFAQLCPTCIGRAGENGFLRDRLKRALAVRAAATVPSEAAPAVGAAPTEVGAADGHGSEAGPAAGPEVGAAPPIPDGATTSGLDPEMVAYYAARAPEYDDWYLRRGRYEHGPIHDVAWAAELDEATRWLDGLPLAGEIVELAAGTGWWSPLLASKARELSVYDAAEEPLDRARERLVAHRLRAHIHIRDAWAEPDRQVDALFAGFWLSHVPRPALPRFLGVARRWLRDGGTFAFIDSRFDPESGAVDQRATQVGNTVTRRLADGREFAIPKVYYEPGELEDALQAAGFEGASVAATARFFLLGRAIA